MQSWNWNNFGAENSYGNDGRLYLLWKSPSKYPMLNLLKPPRRTQPRTQGIGMRARDKREALGTGLIIVGLIMAVGGGLYSLSDYRRLSSEQLAWKAIIEIMAPELTATGIGVFLTVLGIIIFFASSNKQAVRNTKKLFGKFWG